MGGELACLHSRVILTALFMLLALGIHSATLAEEITSVKQGVTSPSCPEGTDGRLEYRAKYFKTDWVVSETPAQPDLAVAIIGRITNKAAAPLDLPHPARAFHRGVRIEFPDGSAAAAEVPVFLPPAGTPETLHLAPGESYMFLQGAVARTPEMKAHPLLDKKVRVSAQVSAPAGAPPGDQALWSGCVGARIGDVTIPSTDTSERYHASEKLADFAARLRREAPLR